MLVKETDPTTSGHFEQVKFVMFASNCVPTVSIGNPNITTVTDSGQITLFVWLKIGLLIFHADIFDFRRKSTIPLDTPCQI